MKPAAPIQRHEVFDLIQKATHFRFQTGVDSNGTATPETIPPNTILVQYIRAAPQKGLMTVSPSNANGLYKVQTFGRLPEPSPLSQKTAKKRMWDASQAYYAQGLYEGPVTLTIAIPIEEIKKETFGESSDDVKAMNLQRSNAICDYIHTGGEDMVNAFHQKAISIMGLAKTKETFDPFEL